MEEDLGPGLCCPDWTSDEAEAMDRLWLPTDSLWLPTDSLWLPTDSLLSSLGGEEEYVPFLGFDHASFLGESGVNFELRQRNCVFEVGSWMPVKQDLADSSPASSSKQRRHKQRKSSKISQEQYEELWRIRESLPKQVECPFCHEYNTRFYDFNNYRANQPRYKCKECNKAFTYGRKPRARKPTNSATQKQRPATEKQKQSRPKTTEKPKQRRAKTTEKQKQRRGKTTERQKQNRAKTSGI